jgi:hypothetical protein
VGATISKLAVKLTADTGKFVQGMNKGSKGVNKMSKSTMGFGAKLGVVGAAVAGATAGILALSKAASAVGEAFVRMDAAAKTARSINMAAQSFQGLQHAASLAGVEGEQMTGGLSKMLKGLGEACNGTRSGTDCNGATRYQHAGHAAAIDRRAVPKDRRRSK